MPQSSINELAKIRTAKKDLINFYSALIKMLKKADIANSVHALNEIVSNAQYITDGSNNSLNESLNQHLAGNRHYNSAEYRLHWDEDFMNNARNLDKSYGIIPKSQVLIDMHAWRNPYPYSSRGEWQESSENYPHIKTELPNAIDAVNKNPFYWLTAYHRDSNDYLVKNLDSKTVIDFLRNMIISFKNKYTIAKANI